MSILPSRLASRRLRIGVLLVLMVSVAANESFAQEPDFGTVVDTAEVGYYYFDLGEEIDSMYVVVDRKFGSSRYIANRDSIRLSTGEHHFTIATQITRDLTFSATVRPGEVGTVQVPLLRERDRSTYYRQSSYPVLRTGANLTVMTGRDSRIIVDGEPRGQGRTRLRVSGGRHRVEVSHPKAGRTERVVTVRTDPPRLTRVTMFTKPSRRVARVRSVVPGLAQLHKGHMVSGGALLVGFGISSVAAVHQHVVYASNEEELAGVRLRYQQAGNEMRAFRLGNRAERLQDTVQQAYRVRNLLLGVAAGAYLYSFFDAWLNRPSGGYRMPVSEQPRVQPLLGKRHSGIRLVFSF